ncbi:hypothetical protein BHE74_00029156 [Ensete ventricosum]|nr:hypothetical protein BHE74_00029156 [Ensete ventricosum]
MENPELILFNSMSKQKEVFKTRVEGQVSMYVCGVTPYDFSHIGHARAYVAFDVLYRSTSFPFFVLRSLLSFSASDLRHFHLNLIVKNGYGYTIEGDVYFSIDRFPDYCQLSGRKLDDNRAGGGGRVSVDLRKQNPADFALWKVRSCLIVFLDVAFALPCSNYCLIFRLLSLVNQAGIVLGALEDLVGISNAKQQRPLILTLLALEKTVKDVLGILGLLGSSCAELIEDRNLARKNKEYEKSDMIRKELYDKGIALMDEPKGTVWRPCEPPDFSLKTMQRGRGGRDDFFGFGDPFSGFGGFGRPGSLMSSFFGGRDPFDDPFFTQPFGSLMGPSMLGPSMFAGRGSLFGETSNAGFLEQVPPVNKSKGPIIQELSDDDDDGGGEGEKADKEQKENPRKHSRTSKEPFVQDPDEVEGVDADLLASAFQL